MKTATGSSTCWPAINCRASGDERVSTHKMGIASSILEAAHRELHRYPRLRAGKVGLRTRGCAGPGSESLRFCFEALMKGTEFEPLDHAIERCSVPEGDELGLGYCLGRRRENVASSRGNDRGERIALLQNEVAREVRP